MSKSKLIWSFAFILISIISLPIAYAQAFTGSRIFFILVNAAIIGIVLFILQAFLIPGKPDKEKVSAWVIILIASLLISWFYGTNGYIWEVGPLALIFNPVVIINTVIIGIVLYLLSGFLDLKKRLNTSEGQVGLTIIIFLISLIIAVKIGPKWLWHQDIVISLMGFLFYVDKDGYGGILNPFHPYYKLWIFISLFVVIAFFFNNFLLKANKEAKMNTALALILAGHMTYNGISPNNVITIAEVLFVLILQDSLKDSITNKWWRWIVAIFLIMWAGYAVSSATGYGGLSTTVLGKSPGVAGGIFYGIGWLIKAGFVLGGGVLAYWLIKKYMPGGTP